VGPRGVAGLAPRLGARFEPGEDAGGDRPRLVLRDGARVGHYPDDVVGAVAAQIKQRGIVLRRGQLLFEVGDLAVLLGELLLGQRERRLLDLLLGPVLARVEHGFDALAGGNRSVEPRALSGRERVEDFLQYLLVLRDVANPQHRGHLRHHGFVVGVEAVGAHQLIVGERVALAFGPIGVSEPHREAAADTKARMVIEPIVQVPRIAHALPALPVGP
jgi:hypothetical protein